LSVIEKNIKEGHNTFNSMILPWRTVLCLDF
jgi:hypothetical protein